MYILVEKFGFSSDELVEMQPENAFLASLVFLGFYGLKSLTVFFPIPILYIAVAHFFNTSLALTINFIGIMIAASIPFAIGRHKSSEEFDTFINENETMKKVLSLQHDNTFFSVYMIRMLQLPVDLTSMFLGTRDISYWPYVLGTLCGMGPTMVGITILGENISEPSSPMFLKSFAIMCGLVVVSFLIFYRSMKKKYPEINLLDLFRKK